MKLGYYLIAGASANFNNCVEIAIAFKSCAYESAIYRSGEGHLHRRKRFNVLGALNAITHEIITVTNETYINAARICELIPKLAALKLKVPITIVCDNARSQKCKLVQELAEQLEIKLLYLPSYSPNLNLIERLWKLVKKQ